MVGGANKNSDTEGIYIYIYIEKQGGGIYLYENDCVSITTNKVNKC